MTESLAQTAGNGRALSQNGEPKEPILITQAGIQLSSVEQVWRMATLLHQSQLVPASFKTPQQIVVALLRAIELGLPPLQALEGMSVINNRVGLMGDLALSMVESSGLLESKKVEYAGQGDSLSCTVTLQRRGREAQSYSFTVKEAKAAEIYDRSSTWRNYPRRMVYYRALGFGLRDEFSDVLKGTKTVEELMDYPAEEPRTGRRVKVVQSVESQKSEPVTQRNGNGASHGERVHHVHADSGTLNSTDNKGARESVQSTNGVSSLEQVRRRLEESKISEREFIDILKFSRLPEAQNLTSLSSVPERFLVMALSGWDTVEEIAAELRERVGEAK